MISCQGHFRLLRPGLRCESDGSAWALETHVDQPQERRLVGLLVLPAACRGSLVDHFGPELPLQCCSCYEVSSQAMRGTARTSEGMYISGGERRAHVRLPSAKTRNCGGLAWWRYPRYFVGATFWVHPSWWIFCAPMGGMFWGPMLWVAHSGCTLHGGCTQNVPPTKSLQSHGSGGTLSDPVAYDIVCITPMLPYLNACLHKADVHRPCGCTQR